VRQALKKKDREAEIQRMSERFQRSMIRYNLYFKNIPKGTEEEELKEFFA
jgi:RNA recognition motif-containing protein